MALTGDGGDELFAGYESFLDIERLRWLDHVPSLLRALISRIADRLPYSTYGKNYLRMISRPIGAGTLFRKRVTALSFCSACSRQSGCRPPTQPSSRARSRTALLAESADALTQALYFEATAKLTGDMLVKVDRMSMANSLEVRCPMLDHELAELAARIPHAWKLKNGRGKDIFIRAVGHRLPPELLESAQARVRRAARELVPRLAQKLRLGPSHQPGLFRPAASFHPSS